jgi:hypothetical protein
MFPRQGTLPLETIAGFTFELNKIPTLGWASEVTQLVAVALVVAKALGVLLGSQSPSKKIQEKN